MSGPIQYDQGIKIDSTNTSNIGLVIFTNNSNTSIKFDNNSGVNNSELESSNNVLNIKLNNELHTQFTSNSLNLFNNTFSINKNVNNIEFNTNNDSISYLNFNNEIRVDNLKVPTLNWSNNSTLDPKILPNINLSRYAFKTGRNVGFGADVPISKVHIKNGDLLLEGGYIGINADLDNIRVPEYPLHIRKGHHYDGIAIKVENTPSKSSFIVYANKPTIGIGTDVIDNLDISLYAVNDIHCRNIKLQGGIISTVNNSNIEIQANLILSNYDIFLDGLDGLSLKKTISTLFGSSNISFGGNNVSDEYKLDVLNNTKKVASFGNSNNGDSLISFYNNNSFANRINIGKDMNLNFKIELNDLLKFEFTQDGNIKINSNLNTFNVLTTNNLNTYNLLTTNIFPLKNDIENTTVLLNNNIFILSIVCDTIYTFILFKDGSVLKLGLNGTKAEKVTFQNNSLIILNIKFIGLKYNYLYIITDDGKSYYNNSTNFESNILNMSNLIDDIKLLYRIYNAFVYVTNEVPNKINIYNSNSNELLSSHSLSFNIKKITASLTNTFNVLTEENKLYRFIFGIIYSKNQINTTSLSSIKDISGEYILYGDNTLSSVIDCNNKLRNIDDILINNANYLYNDTVGNSFAYLDSTNKIYVRGSIKSNSDNNLFENLQIDESLLYPMFNKIIISDRHYIATDGIDIFTGGKDIGPNKYNGLGRKDNQFRFIKKINIPTPTNDMMFLKLNNSLCIGDTFKFIKKENLLQNTLNVESYCGIGTIANSNYMLTVNGDINIIGGSIYQNGMIVGSDAIISSPNLIIPSLDGYVTYAALNYNYYNIADIHSNINSNYTHTLDYVASNFLSNNTILIDSDYVMNVIQNKMLWNSNIDCNVVYILNKSVGINVSNVNNSIFTSDIIPALYVGNGVGKYDKKIRGIICADDIAALSDISLKKDIKQIKNALDKVNNLTGVTYLRKDYNNSKEYMGLIAQDVEKVIPQVVGQLDDIKTVAYGNIVALLIESIKELHTLIINK